MKNRDLSKSKLLSALQCQKRLWLEIYRPELQPEDPQLQARFDAGHAVGDTARQLAGKGVLVGTPENFRAALETTKTLIDGRSPLLFEAAFEVDGVRVRADILERSKGKSHVREVKSSTSVKDYHYNDAAVQKWVMDAAGQRVSSIAIQHLDGQFVYPGNGNFRGIFTSVDVSKAVKPLLSQVPAWIAEARTTLAGKEPVVPMGPHCNDPFACPFSSYCEGLVPQPRLPLSLLPNASRTIPKLLQEGFASLDRIPEGRLSEGQDRVRRVHLSGKADFDRSARGVMAEIDFPRSYLDFETMGFAIPIWPGTRPWQQVPFQFSVITENARGMTRPYEFLDTSGESPVKPLADALVAALPEKGPILVYNQSMEAGCLELLAALVPQRAKALLHSKKRLVDLWPITKKAWYHPDMRGSWSLKDVIGTVPGGKGYGDLDEVAHGGAAQTAWMEAVAPETSAQRKHVLRKALLEYCKRDTESLVVLARFLKMGP